LRLLPPPMLVPPCLKPLGLVVVRGLGFLGEGLKSSTLACGTSPGPGLTISTSPPRFFTSFAAIAKHIVRYSLVPSSTSVSRLACKSLRPLFCVSIPRFFSIDSACICARFHDMSLLFSQENGCVKMVFRSPVCEVRNSDIARGANSVWQTERTVCVIGRFRLGAPRIVTPEGASRATQAAKPSEKRLPTEPLRAGRR
jgi:hypothetical protein